MVRLVTTDHSYVYLMKSRAKSGWYKIGYSSDPEQRADKLNKDVSKLDWEPIGTAWFPNEDAAHMQGDASLCTLWKSFIKRVWVVEFHHPNEPHIHLSELTLVLEVPNPLCRLGVAQLLG